MFALWLLGSNQQLHICPQVGYPAPHTRAASGLRGGLYRLMIAGAGSNAAHAATLLGRILPVSLRSRLTLGFRFVRGLDGGRILPGAAGDTVGFAADLWLLLTSAAEGTRAASLRGGDPTRGEPAWTRALRGRLGRIEHSALGGAYQSQASFALRDEQRYEGNAAVAFGQDNRIIRHRQSHSRWRQRP